MNIMESTSDANIKEIVSNTMNLRELPVDILDSIELNGFDLICINDFSGKIIYISESVNKLLGYNKKKLTGKSIFRFIMKKDQTNLISYVSQTFDIEQKYDLHLRNHIGKFISFETKSKVIVRDGKKEILSLLHDNSDKKHAEEMLIRSEKMSIAGQLAAGIAHEIRNPLTSLKGFIQLLQAGMDNKNEYYQIMIDEIEKINTITSELLFISKPMTEDKKLEKLTDLLDDVIILLNTQAKLFDIELSLSVEEQATLFCDRSQIKQVLINLIKNAIEEMPDGGRIEVTLVRKNETYVISIKDQGPGIPPHLIHKLKEPFYTTKKSGTGLGLMISNQIIQNHDGDLDIESSQGEGSTFHITLPKYGTK